MMPVEDPGPLRVRAFFLLTCSCGLENLAIWAFYGTLIATFTYKLNADVRQLAMLGAALSLPYVLGTVLWGFVVDRWSPKWVYVIGLCSMLASILVGWGAASTVRTVGAVLLLGLGLGALEPSRSAITALVIPQADLVRANAVLSLTLQITLLTGSFLGGLLLEATNASMAHAASLLVGVLALPFALLIPDVRQRGVVPELTLTDLGRGLRTSWNTPELRLLLFISATGWMVFSTFFVFEPIYVRTVLHGEESAILFLWASHGVGAIAGAVVITRVRRGTGRELALVGSGVVVSGIGLLIYAGFGTFALALLGAAGMGAGLAFIFPPALALVQRVVQEEERGRVSGVLMSMQELMAFVGSVTIVVLAVPDGAVTGVLLGIGVFMILVGAMGLRAVRRMRTRSSG